MSNYKRKEENKQGTNSGIYCITNIINNKKYVGQTYDLDYRWARHKSDLKNNHHSNKHLQFAWNKYSEDCFVFLILEHCDLSIIDDREKYWIDYYDCLNSGYNLASGGLGCRGYKHTDEEIAKMRMIQNPKPILQIDFDGNIISEWVSAGEAANALGLKYKGGIISCCKKQKYMTSNGFIWIYKDDLPTFNLQDHLNANKGNYKKIQQYSIDNEFIKEWESAKSIQRQLHISAGQIITICDGGGYTYKNYIWKYKDSPCFTEDVYNNIKNINRCVATKVDMYSIAGDYIDTFDTMTKAATYVNSSAADIALCCSGKRQTAKGYRWSIHNEELKPYIKYAPQKTTKKVFQYDLYGNFITEFNSITEAGISMGVTISPISKAINSKKPYKGFVFKTNSERGS